MAKDGKKSRDQLQLAEELGRLKEENKGLRTQHWSSAAAKIATPLFKWLSIAFIVYQFQIAVSNHAGKRTEADYNLRANGDIDVTVDAGEELQGLFGNLTWGQWAASAGLIFGWAGIMYGRAQRKEKMRVIKKYYPIKLAEEKKLDQGRTSSGLTEKGETRPEDI